MLRQKHQEVHIEQDHFSLQKLCQLSKYKPLKDPSLRAEAAASQGDREAFIWKSVFVKAFPSFLPYKELLNERWYTSI